MPKKVLGSERQRQAAEMRLDLTTYGAIARAMGIGRSRAQQLVAQAATGQLVSAELAIIDTDVDADVLERWLISMANEDGLTLTVRRE